MSEALLKSECVKNTINTFHYYYYVNFVHAFVCSAYCMCGRQGVQVNVLCCIVAQLLSSRRSWPVVSSKIEQAALTTFVKLMVRIEVGVLLYNRSNIV
jgi:hypothetical protein